MVIFNSYVKLPEGKSLVKSRWPIGIDPVETPQATPCCRASAARASASPLLDGSTDFTAHGTERP